MSKSLSESAADILAASIKGAGKEPVDPTGKGIPGAQVVGGSTHEDPDGVDNPGAAAAAPVGDGKKNQSTVAVKGDAKSVKVGAMQEESEEDGDAEELTEEEIEEYLNSLTEEELAALAEELEADEDFEEIYEEDVEQMDEAAPPTYNVTHPDHGVIGTHNANKGFVPSKPHLGFKPSNRIPNGAKIDRGSEIDTEYKNKETRRVEEEAAPELTEEEIAEARKAAMKEMVAKNMGSCKEDIDALFNGESLSDEFKGKAITIFEAAVRARVETVCESLFAENDEILADTVASIEEDLTNSVDEYLNYVVEHWMSENELAIESGLRTEIAEEFMEGLKNLFTECYMEVPEEKADLVEEMADRVVTAEEALAQVQEELAAATKVINEAKAKEILSLACEGLTKMQAEKIKALAEGVEFTTEGDYKHKLAVIRESYFPGNNPVKVELQNLVETDQGTTTDTMNYYVNAITKTLPK